MPKYQCPQCLWVGSTDKMVLCNEKHLECPNCYVIFNKTWEVVNE